MNDDFSVINFIKLKNRERLQEMYLYGLENNIPIISDEVLGLLDFVLKPIKPKRILEVGTAIGYSTLFFSNYLEEGGILYSIEKNDEMYSVASLNLKDEIEDGKIVLINQDGRDEIDLVKNEKFDIIFLDGPKGHYKEIFDLYYKNLKTGGYIISDNVLFKGMVESDELVIRRKKTIVKRLREYLTYISEMEDLDTSIIRIGDGVSISKKK